MGLANTLARLQRTRPMPDIALAPDADRLADLDPPADNPGDLRGRFYAPAKLRDGAPLVVVLHGCTQTAAAYDHGAGWSRLADRHGFALLFPEQKRANNPNLCFTWFEPGDTARDAGEAASIAAMTRDMIARHRIDPARVFVTGLSAGGAMASVMLATYPELFAGGAIIAGLPFGAAGSVAEAFAAMAGRDRANARALGARVRAASAHKGPWPRISVWQGGADATVAPTNADAIVRQWANVHELSALPHRTDTVDGIPRRVWRGPDGTELIEHYVVPDMAHGTPLAPGDGAGRSGVAGAHMLDAGISSTDRIAAFWGIAPAAADPRRRKPAVATPADLPIPDVPNVQFVIENALRSAGLIR